MFFVRYLGILWVLFMHSGVVAQQWQVGPPGMPLPIIVPGGGQTPCKVDFEDFIAFAQAFNSTQGDPNFNHLADTNQDGVVNFPDFIAFSGVFGVTSTNGNCSSYKVLGDIVSQDEPVTNVWIDVLEKQISFYSILRNSSDITQTNSTGHFEYPWLESSGDYTLVPKKLGYLFTPDTLRFTLDNASVSLPPIEGVKQFGLVDVKVLQDSLPVDEVEVQFAPSEDIQNVVGTGITDPSGVSMVRVSVREGQTHITGLYDVKVIRPSTGEVLDTWTHISVQSEDKQRLFLEVGHEAVYMPKREYHSYRQGRSQFFLPSEAFVTAKFREDVSDSMKQDLLKEVGLRRNDYSGVIDDLILTEARGYFAVLDVLYHLRKSGKVDYANPGFSLGQGAFIPTDEIKVHFHTDVSLVQVGDFATEIDATVNGFEEGSVYQLRLNKPLVQDVFEIETQYRDHPLVDQIEILGFETRIFIN